MISRRFISINPRAAGAEPRTRLIDELVPATSLSFAQSEISVDLRRHDRDERNKQESWLMEDRNPALYIHRVSSYAKAVSGGGHPLLRARQ